MNINRHNYERFFLLYVDKELSATERKAVDVFVKENPDLQMELILLQQTIIKADDIVLDKKDWLYREEEITALQENLLLYADEELSATDKKAVESLLVNDNAALVEWHTLQQTKLQPDMAVVFENKQSLYRKEGGRVVGLRWWRAAAAAVMLGFILWGAVAVYKNNLTPKINSTELANGKDTKTQQNNTGTTVHVTAVAEEKKTTANLVSPTVTGNNQTTSSENIKTVDEKNNKENTVAAKNNVTLQHNNNKKSDDNLTITSLQNINSNGSNKKVVTGVLPANSNSIRVSGNNDALVKANPRENTNNAITDVNNGKPDPNTTAIAVVNNITANGENNNRYLNVDDNKEKRTALGGFLRKAKRVIERTTNVKTGEGVKIAGFEIALK